MGGLAVNDADNPEPDELPIPDWHREELDRRLAEDDAEPEAGAPWEEVRARLERATQRT